MFLWKINFSLVRLTNSLYNVAIAIDDHFRLTLICHLKIGMYFLIFPYIVLFLLVMPLPFLGFCHWRQGIFQRYLSANIQINEVIKKTDELAEVILLFTIS